MRLGSICRIFVGRVQSEVVRSGLASMDVLCVRVGARPRDFHRQPKTYPLIGSNLIGPRPYDRTAASVMNTLKPAPSILTLVEVSDSGERVERS